jgi:hypothetical protein
MTPTTSRYVKERADRWVMWGLGIVVTVAIAISAAQVARLQSSIDKLTETVVELRETMVEVRHLQGTVTDHEQRIRDLERI